MTIPIGPFVVILSQIKELVIRILEMFLAELSRKFGNHVTVHRPTARRSVRTTGIPIFTLTFSSYFGSPLIAHQCCDQLTAVKTRYPLTSITWPYRGLRCRPIEVEYFFEVIRWQVTSFQMIAGSLFFIHIKYVFMSLWPSTINTLISNWPRTPKFSQLFKNASREDRCFSLFSP